MGVARRQVRALEERNASKAQRCITPHPDLPPQRGEGVFFLLEGVSRIAELRYPSDL
jgi:hypothetical protein